MALIEQRILKIAPITEVALPPWGYKVELRLLQPAFEPFLLARFVVLNCKTDVLLSVQLRPHDKSDFHYMNIVGDPRWPSNTVLQITAVADLPLSRHPNWDVVAILANNEEQVLGSIRKDAYAVWHFASPEPSSDREQRSELGLDRKQRTQIVFVGGAPKSGTTWVQEILNTHPRILATGENQLFDWPPPTSLSQVLEATPPPYFAAAVPRNPPFRTQVALLFAGRAERLLRQIAQVADVDVICDKAPAYGAHIIEILKTIPESKYIHCVRHPLDVAVSRFFHERNLLLDTPALSALPQDPELRDHVRNYDALKAKPGDMFRLLKLLDWTLDAGLEGEIALRIKENDPRIYIVRYEDLLADFHATARGLFEFCGQTVDDSFLEGAAARTRFAVMSGGRPAGDEDVRHFFRKGIAGDHRSHMTQAQIAYAMHRILLQSDWYNAYFSGADDA